MSFNTEEIKIALKNWQELVKDYQVPDNKKALLQIMSSFLPYVAIWVLMYISLDYSYWLTLLLAIANAFFTVRIFIIQHDCGHQSYLKSRKTNNVIGTICSMFSMIPYQYWARSHNFHHAHNGQFENRDIGDITTLTVNEYKEKTSWGKFQYRLYRSPLVMFFIGPVYYLLVHNRLPLIQFKDWKKERQALLINNVLLIGLYTSLCFLFGWKTFVLIQLPIIVFFAVIAVWFFYVQHQHNPNYKQWKENWEYLLSAIRGSSYYRLPKIFHWLTGNIGYHHIHHLSSLIPSYNLPKCNKENPIFEKYAYVMSFTDSLKCIFHKLWDEETQRMISFREFNKKYAIA